MAAKGQLTTADYLHIEDFNRLVAGLNSDKKYLWELYCRLSFCTALRASDVLTIRWEDIHGKTAFTKTEQKTRKTRSIKINESVKNKLLELYTTLGSPEKNTFVFNNPATNLPYSIEYINRLLKQFKVKYRLPIKAFSTHTFRKTFGRYVYEKNGRSAESLILLNTIFMHTSIDITKAYIGIKQDEIDKIYDSIKF